MPGHPTGSASSKPSTTVEGVIDESMRDQEAAHCHDVKRKLGEIVATSGKRALIRIAWRELESWVLGDLRAVAEAFGEPSVANHPRVARPLVTRPTPAAPTSARSQEVSRNHLDRM